MPVGGAGELPGAEHETPEAAPGESPAGRVREEGGGDEPKHGAAEAAAAAEQAHEEHAAGRRWPWQGGGSAAAAAPHRDGEKADAAQESEKKE